jgi:hypothetical protein
MRVERRGPVDQRHPTRPVAGIRDETAQKGNRVAVHRVERNRSLGRLPKGVEIAAEEQGRREGLMREMVGRREIHRPPSRVERAPQRVGARVEVVLVLVLHEEREQRPDVGGAWRTFGRAFQRRSNKRMFVG